MSLNSNPNNPTSSTTIIPNVSCVFRDLVQLSHTTQPRLNTTKQQQQSYSNNTNYNYYNNNNNNRQFDYNNSSSSNKQRVDLISNMGVDDRQRRHEQLMNRFKSSMEENRQLLGINQSPKEYQYQYQRANINQNRNIAAEQYPINQPYYHNQQQQYLNNIISQSQQNKWSIPQIKYRHIEDFQQKRSQLKTITNDNKQFNNKDQSSNKSQQVTEINTNQPQATQSKLQRQFYENNNQQGEQLASKYSRFANNQREQQTKYNQNLLSYYELCRKPLRPALYKQEAVIKQTTKQNEQKFLRRPQSKVGGINLSKAIHILSLD